MDIDFDVRTPENEKITKEIYNMLIGLKYKDWKKISGVIEKIYELNDYKRITKETNKNRVVDKIIRTECHDYRIFK